MRFKGFWRPSRRLRILWTQSPLMVLLILGARPALSQIQWPLEPFNESHQIRRTYGDWSGYNVFQTESTGALGYHSGVDMPGTLWMPVHAAKAGTIRCVYTDPGGSQGYITIGNTTTDSLAWLYGHLDSLRFRKRDVNVTAVIAGQELGLMAQHLTFYHLHFMRSDSTHWELAGYCNPLDSLRPLPSMCPRIDSELYFVENLMEDTLSNRNDTLWGDIDIIVKASSDIEGDTGSGVYGIGFEVEGPIESRSSDDIAFRTMFEMRGVIEVSDSAKYYITYADTGLDSLSQQFRNWYIITNCGPGRPSEDDGLSNIEESMWDTDVPIDQSPVYSYPQYPDGPYTVEVRAWVYPDPEHGVMPAVARAEVMLDNHVPVVRRVVIKQGGGVIYDSKEGINFPGFPDDTLFFDIWFSESMEPDSTPSVTYAPEALPESSDTVMEIGWDTTYCPDDIWMGWAVPGPGQIGVNRLNVKAWDLHGHELDSLVSTVAYRDSIGVWQNYESGPDKNHTFTISEVEGVYIVDNGNHRIQVFDTSGSFKSSFGETVLYGPIDIAIDYSKNSYIVDDSSSDYRIKKFDPADTLVAQSGTFANAIRGVTTDNNSVYVTTGDSVRILRRSDLNVEGSWKPPIDEPEGIDYNFAANTLYIIHHSDDYPTLARYTSAGVFMDSVPVDTGYNLIYSSPTTDNSKVYVPVNLQDGMVPSIKVFYLNLDTLETIPIDTVPFYHEILGIAVDNKHIYISQANDSITFLNKVTHDVDTAFGGTGTGTEEFINPRGIALCIPSQTTSASSPPSDISFTNSQMEEIGKKRLFPYIFALSQNIPNPFYQTTRIVYQVPNTSPVALEIYSVAGQLVRTLVHEEKTPGFYSAEWYGKDETGRQVPSGVYFYHLDAGNFTATKKLILVR